MIPYILAADTEAATLWARAIPALPSVVAFLTAVVSAAIAYRVAKLTNDRADRRERDGRMDRRQIDFRERRLKAHTDVLAALAGLYQEASKTNADTPRQDSAIDDLNRALYVAELLVSSQAIGVAYSAAEALLAMVSEDAPEEVGDRPSLADQFLHQREKYIELARRDITPLLGDQE